MLLTTMANDGQFRSLTDRLVEVTVLLTHVIMASHMCNKLLAMATYKTVVLYLHHSLYTLNIAYIMGQHMTGYLTLSNISKYTHDT